MERQRARSQQRNDLGIAPVALRTFYRQILSVLYSSFPFGNFRPRLVRVLLVCWADDKCIVLNINTCGAKVNSRSIQTPASKRTRKLRDVEVQLVLVEQ